MDKCVEFQDHPAVQKRLAILTCQLRKADLSKKTYEVATEKLLQFTEVGSRDYLQLEPWGGGANKVLG